jgi:prophage antirepressor-like protein
MELSAFKTPEVLGAFNPWFVLVDVCRVLEIGIPSDAARRLG